MEHFSFSAKISSGNRGVLKKFLCMLYTFFYYEFAINKLTGDLK